MKTLRFVLGDQLTRSLSSLADLDPANDVVLMVEAAQETTYVRHHKQKIALILAAMRGFARELRGEGIDVDYVRLDDPANTGSFVGELARAVARHSPDRIVMTESGEWRVEEAMAAADVGVFVEVRADDRFFCSRERFARWARGRQSYRMEFFYREMRREHGLLMDGAEPAGGQWNFDAENRKRLPKAWRAIPRPRAPRDETTQEVLDLVARRFPDHFGDLDGFDWATTREGALAALASSAPSASAKRPSRNSSLARLTQARG